MIKKQNIFPQSWKGKENKVVLAISLVIYVVALFNTSYYRALRPCDILYPNSDWISTIKEGVPCWLDFLFNIFTFPIAFLHLINHWEIYFDLVPITNLFYYYCCWQFLHNKRKKRTLILMGACSLIVFLFSFYYDDMLPPFDSEHYLKVGRKGLGYYLWLLSYLCLFIGRWIVPEPVTNTIKDDVITKEENEKADHHLDENR